LEKKTLKTPSMITGSGILKIIGEMLPKGENEMNFRVFNCHHNFYFFQNQTYKTFIFYIGSSR
jgi:hypothetical protein